MQLPTSSSSSTLSHHISPSPSFAIGCGTVEIELARSVSTFLAPSPLPRFACANEAAHHHRHLTHLNPAPHSIGSRYLLRKHIRNRATVARFWVFGPKPLRASPNGHSRSHHYLISEYGPLLDPIPAQWKMQMNQVLPGDVISIGEFRAIPYLHLLTLRPVVHQQTEMTIPADILLISGTCVVNGAGGTATIRYLLKVAGQGANVDCPTPDEARLAKAEGDISDLQKAKRSLESELQSVRSRQIDADGHLGEAIQAKEVSLEI